MQRCIKCQLEKPLTEFYVYKRSGKPRGTCKACHIAECVARAQADPETHNARTRAWRAANPGRASQISRAWQLRNPEKFRNVQAKTRFNIDFAAMWDSQEGRCACCGEPMLKEGREPTSVCVDHDRSHCPGAKSCGACVRGLIHWRCNMILGYARDDVRLLRSAVAYLDDRPRTIPFMGVREQNPALTGE